VSTADLGKSRFVPEPSSIKGSSVSSPPILTLQDERERLAVAIADGERINWQQVAAAGVLPASEILALRALEGRRIPVPEESDLAPGKVVGDFRLVSVIGEGGMGQVWEVEQLSLSRRVALKFVRSDRVTEHQLELFAREARAGGRMNHAGIVTIYGHGRSNRLAWIAMERVPGGRNLRNVLDETARARELPADHDRRVARYVAEIAEAMQVAHAAGVIHRDLKPQNVLITPEDRPKVTDFGVARITDEQALSHSGEPAGTYLYMSPEQLSGKRADVDGRSDVFSLGVVLYELSTLRRPFEGDTSHQVAQQILSKDPPDPRTVRSRVPQDLAVIVGKALEKERGRRYPTMEEFARDLRRFLAGEPIHARPPTAMRRLLQWMRRHPARSAAAAIASVAVLVISLLLLENVDANRDLRAAVLALRSKTTEAEGNARAASEQATLATTRAEDLLRLSALQDLEDLLAAADGLWPAHPENIDAFGKWIQEARERVAELPLHRSKRDELRAKALPQSPAERQAERERHPDYPRWIELEGERSAEARTAGAATSESELRAAREGLSATEEEFHNLEARLDERRDWSFPVEEREARWWNNQLTKLIEGLEDLEGGLLREGATTEAYGWSLPKRLAFARALQAGFARDGEYTRAWAQVLPAIHSTYPGLALTPQLGLVPIGPDPASKLWEFAHLATGEPAVRGPDGRLVLTEASGLVFVLLPGGTFHMGAQSLDPAGPNHDPQAQKDESPVHEVKLSPFFLSKYEMSQAQWQRFAGRNPSVYPIVEDLETKERIPAPLHPVEQVNWPTCMEACARMGLSLPSEAQWEYAARGGTRTVWWTGNERESLRGAVNLADQAAARADASWPEIKDWPDLDDGFGAHAPVNRYTPNPFGLHNVHGNVSEWCLDGNDGVSYPDGPTSDPVKDPSGCPLREHRGACFFYAAVSARSANRSHCAPDFKSSEIGLRPARAVLP